MFEHYLDAGGIISANLFGRKIENPIRNVRAEEVVSWATVPRWVSRPQNIGGAVSGRPGAGRQVPRARPVGHRGADHLCAPTAARCGRGWTACLAPNNRIDQQPRWTAPTWASTTLRTPLTLGSNVNYTPASVIQQPRFADLPAGRQQVIDAYALWRFGTSASARVVVLQRPARDDYATNSTYLLDDGSQEIARPPRPHLHHRHAAGRAAVLTAFTPRAGHRCQRAPSWRRAGAGHAGPAPPPPAGCGHSPISARSRLSSSCGRCR